MNILPFETEQFFARHEFQTRWQLCNSDCEAITIRDLLSLAGMELETLGEEKLSYTESTGSAELRQAIAEMHSYGQADDVVVLGTPVEGIYLAARALLEPGDEVVVLTPAYDALTNLFEHIAGSGCVRKWQFQAGPDNWELDLEDLRQLLSPRTRLLVVNFPHNPTGYLPSPAMQKALVELVEEHDLWLFYDEMYFGLVNEGTPPIPSAAGMTRQSIVLSGLSKTHGLPGLRSGWLVVPDRALRENIINWKFYTSICPPVPSEFLAKAALSTWESLRDRNLARIDRNLKVADTFFARWPGLFKWRRPRAGSTALVEFRIDSVSALSEHLAREESVLIQSASMLGSDDQHMRIGLGREDFPQALAHFEAWLEKSGLADS